MSSPRPIDNGYPNQTPTRFRVTDMIGYDAARAEQGAMPAPNGGAAQMMAAYEEAVNNQVQDDMSPQPITSGSIYSAYIGRPNQRLRPTDRFGWGRPCCWVSRRRTRRTT